MNKEVLKKKFKEPSLKNKKYCSMESMAHKSKERLADLCNNSRAEWHTANERQMRGEKNDSILGLGREREKAGHLAQGEEVQMVLLHNAKVLSVPSHINAHSLLGFPGGIHSSLRANQRLVSLLHSFHLGFKPIIHLHISKLLNCSCAL